MKYEVKIETKLNMFIQNCKYFKVAPQNIKIFGIYKEWHGITILFYSNFLLDLIIGVGFKENLFKKSPFYSLCENL